MRGIFGESGDPFGKKPVWHLYRALTTHREEDVMKSYLECIEEK
ncbi:hypothetical protein N9195_01085 [bacterium]|nr:hypothetical protein [bacterium]